MVKRLPKTTTIGSYPVFPAQEDVEYYDKMAEKGLLDEILDPYIFTIEETIKDFLASGIEVVSTGQTRGDLYSIFLDPKFVKGIAWKNSQAIVESRIERFSSIRLKDVSYARKILPENFEIKEPITDAYTLARFAKLSTETYTSTEELAKEINTKIVIREIEDLQNSGAVSAIQLDSPIISAESYMPDYVKDLYEEIRKVAKLPVVMHACGDTVRIFRKLINFNVDVLSLDFYHYPRLLDEASASNYGQMIGLGVLDSQSPRVESVQEISLLMQKAREKIGDEKIAYVHPHCGQRSLHRNTAFEKNVRMTVARNDVYYGEARDVSSYTLRKGISRNGYYLVNVDNENKQIIVTYYSFNHEPIARYRARNAEAIISVLQKEKKTTEEEKDIALLAVELGRAEVSLSLQGSSYRQRILQ